MVAPSKEIPFPMLRLPYLAQKYVGQQFEVPDQMTFSVLSKRAAKRMSWSTQHIDMIEINFYDEEIVIYETKAFGLNIYWSSRTADESGYPTKFSIEGRIHKFHQIRPDFTTNQWLQHFMQLFHCKTLKVMLPDCASSNNAQWMIDAIKGIPIGAMRIGPRMKERGVEIMKQCMPPKKLALCGNPFANKDQLKNWLLENDLYMFEFCDPELQMNVDDIRNMRNIKILEIWKQQMRCADINKLLKMWMNGWNPNMEAMLFRLYRSHRYTVERYENELFRGVTKTTVRNQVIHPFLKKNFFYTLMAVHKAYEIKRHDGVRANLAIKEKEYNLYFQFVVLP